MGARGKSSFSSLSVVSPIRAVRRPDPPQDLTQEQVSEWVAVVNRLPADWFTRETHGMLAQYCRHVVTARRVAQLVAAYEISEQFSVKEYDRLLKMQEREGRAISSLATRMRMSQHSTFDEKKRKPIDPTEKPWQAQ